MINSSYILHRLFVVAYASALGVFSIIGTIYLLDIGHTFIQIGWYAAALGVAVFFSEVPTGVFADRLGSKLSLFVSSIIRVIIGLIYLFFTESFYAILLSSILAGISESFFSGAFQKLSLHVGARSGMSTSSTFSSISYYRFLGLFLGGGIGYLAYETNIFSPWLYVVVAFSLASFFMYRLSDEQHKAVYSDCTGCSPDLFSIARNVLTLPSSWALAFNTFSAVAPIMAWQYIFDGDRYGLVYGFLAMQIWRDGWV